jgi:alkylhydroperoxidase family enzyme
MSYLPLTDYESASDEVKKEYDYWTKRSGRVTNMKRLLLHDEPTYHAYMEWYTLYARLTNVVSKRAVDLLCYAVSTNNHCLLCSTFFQQIFVDVGEDPDNFVLNSTEQLLFDLGAAIAQNPNAVPDEIYVQIKEQFTTEQIVLIIGFAAQMVATNYFNMATRVAIDEPLEPYITPEFLAKISAEER